jgi:hypothetical protein
MNDKWFTERVISSRVFILGAGFSAAAGVPLTSELLSKAMQMMKIECDGIFERIDGYARDCFQISENESINYADVGFSELCTFLEYIELREYGGGARASDNGSREKVNLRYYLAKTLMKMTPEGDQIPPLYLDFANELNENDIVLSFNWDLLLERALIQAGKGFTYVYDEKKIKIYKLHGSVNWRRDVAPYYFKSNVDLQWESMKLTEGMMDVEIYYSMKLIEASYWNGLARNHEIDPFLVLPGYGKAFDVRDNAVLWYKPEFYFALTHDIYIIGLSLAPDDFFIRSFFLHTLPYLPNETGIDRKIHIINPALDVNINYSFISSSDSSTIHNECFNVSHVQLMRDNRKRSHHI